jgi:site-specific DNA recombinase
VCRDDSRAGGAAVRARRIDVIVVYKVDRLTRSLADFAKLVELFDEHRVSFVSVTQAFNTTTSMGRLTLNVLLSFAQFEREVTGERIRDKIAASKKKGIWMGGVVPLGYRVDNRALHVVEEHAAFVRDLFRRYLEIGSVVRLKAALDQENVRLPTRTDGRGKTKGGGLISRGHLYKILSNPIYVGRLTHKDQVHEGLHDPIVDHESWSRVQRLLAEHAQDRAGSRQDSDALLAGKLFDDRGNRMSPSHATKRGHRYRYYVSQAILQGRKADVGSVAPAPAMELQRRIVEAVRGAASADPRERSIETQIIRRGLTVLSPPSTAPRSVRPAPSIPAPTFAPPSSASRSAVQLWRFSLPKGPRETLRIGSLSFPGRRHRPIDAARSSRGKASNPLRCARCEPKRAGFSSMPSATPIVGSTN